jgi:hypothetical protein
LLLFAVLIVFVVLYLFLIYARPLVLFPLSVRDFH